jgi:hypothetical protein
MPTDGATQEAWNDGLVVAVARSAKHEFSKAAALSIRLLPGLGVEGDAHCGATVKHRSRVARDPTQPNLRQVHLIHAELIEGLRADGFAVDPGTMGENITTRGLALLDLPVGRTPADRSRGRRRGHRSAQSVFATRSLSGWPDAGRCSARGGTASWSASPVSWASWSTAAVSSPATAFQSICPLRPIGGWSPSEARPAKAWR